MNLEYRSWIIQELESWSESFNTYYPRYMEEVIEEETKAYEYIHNLINKFTKNECTAKDYEDILFHIWQKNADL